jgi:hypothetical protein
MQPIKFSLKALSCYFIYEIILLISTIFLQDTLHLEKSLKYYTHLEILERILFFPVDSIRTFFLSPYCQVEGACVSFSVDMSSYYLSRGIYIFCIALILRWLYIRLFKRSTHL